MTAQAKRAVRGTVEGLGMSFKPNGIGKALVTATSGSVYEVSETTCTCKDFEHRCQGTGMACKHITAYRIHRARRAADAKRFEEIFG
jgi:predicted nucleic acid-binding Zn finger protein